MRIELHSSHVDGDFSSGRLEVRILREDERAGVSVLDDIYVSVPPDFHAHNDLVATALLTLIGGASPDVSFNFPISTHCATLLRDYYRLTDIGPVDPALAPRVPGTRVGVAFSGGLDSTAVVVLLRELLGEPTAVITNDYAYGFEFERQGFGNVAQDIVCATDFRVKGFVAGGNFNLATPLLFADYLDLRAVANGDPLLTHAVDMASLADGSPPPFLAHAPALLAGGLHDVYLARSLMTPALLRVLMVAAPQLLEPATRAAGSWGSTKPYFKGMTLRALYRADGLPPPVFLDTLPRPRRTFRYGDDPTNDLRALYLLSRGEDAAVRQLFPNLTRVDLAFNAGLRHTYQERYNTNSIAQVSAALRNRLLDAFQRCGIYPYDERDWHEIAILREHVPSLRQAR
jgi:hypothetical protein